MSLVFACNVNMGCHGAIQLCMYVSTKSFIAVIPGAIRRKLRIYIHQTRKLDANSEVNIFSSKGIQPIKSI